MRSSTTGSGLPGLCRVTFLVTLVVAAGSACGGGADPGPAGKGGAALTVGAPAAASTSGQGGHQVIPLPRAASGQPGPGAVPASTGPSATPGPPPVPNLDQLRPTPPPNTVTLEELHKAGQTHVLR